MTGTFAKMLELHGELGVAVHALQLARDKLGACIEIEMNSKLAATRAASRAGGADVKPVADLPPGPGRFNDWFRDRLIWDPQQRARNVELWRDYQDWCAGEDVPVARRLGTKPFANELTRRGIPLVKVRGERFRRGVALAEVPF